MLFLSDQLNHLKQTCIIIQYNKRIMSLPDSLIYASYDAEFLRSKGLIITEDEELGLALVRYHKSDNTWKTEKFGKCDRNDSVVRKHRSVIYDIASKCVIHASPQRRKNESAVVINSLKRDNWEVTEYIDGTMISVFWSPVTNEWIMSSRSKFHASGNFMSPFPFRDLFKKAIPGDLSLDDFLLKFDKDYSYTFVLCHPDHKHVIVVDEPKIYLVHMGKNTPVMGESGKILTKCEYMDIDTIREVAARVGVHTPTRLVFDNDTDFHECIRKTLYNKSPSGLMITQSQANTCNERIRILSVSYEEALCLRGMSPSVQTNMIRVWANDPSGDLLRDYEKYYPDEKEELHSVIRTLYETANELVLYYKNRHVRKSMEHRDLPHWSRKPIWDLHGIYLRDRVPISKDSVLEYYRRRPESFVSKILKNREKEIKRDLAKMNQEENRSDESSLQKE